MSTERSKKPPKTSRHKLPPRRRAVSARARLSARAKAVKARPESSFPIVGVGASAGGFEAFSQLLKSLPADTGMGFVLVQHLDPDHPSALTELLSRVSPIPVREVRNGVAVEPNQVHVIPPNVNMFISRGILRLRRRPDTSPHRSIDIFLESLAQDQKTQAIGVILSGSATDGTRGLEAIKAEGGITFAQDEKSARYDSMPRSAIACGCVDFVLTPPQIAQELGRLGKHPIVLPAIPPVSQPLEEPSDYGKILGILRKRMHLDFTLYKPSTLHRRVHRRMALTKKATLADYVKFLVERPGEVETLYQDLLITVTSFFRDPAAYVALKSKVFPRITRRLSPDDPIRMWVVGCSTGQEAYSIAMAFLEYAEERRGTLPLQIFATDVSEEALERARTGYFPKPLVAEVSPERLRRFFVEADGGYRVGNNLRELCVFARHNVLADPPFSRMDLISCRNLLIYLEPESQKKLMPRFHYALKPGGFLWLGSSESVGSFGNLFTAQDKRRKIYSKKPVLTQHAFAPGRLDTREQFAAHPKAGAAVAALREQDGEREADRLMLARYAPVGVLINADMDVLQFRGDTGPYLKPPEGRPSANLLKLMREGLMLPVRAAVQKARRENVTVRKEEVPVRQNGGTRPVNVEVIPLRNVPRHSKQFLVIFEPQGATAPGAGPRQPGIRKARAEARGSAETARGEAEALTPTVRRLRQELSDTKDYLQTVMEQYEAANEELQSAGEEAQSSNEELQSINEELETSKEELQATNEELTTLNEELQNRNREVDQLNNDLLNLLTSASIPILMLGPDLRIRRLTPITERTLRILPTDVGRSIGDLKLSVDIPELEPLVREVIDTVHPREKEILGPDGRWYTLLIRPYRTTENQIDGAVVALLDVDALKRSEQQSREGREYAQALVDTVREGLLVLDSQLVVRGANDSFYQMFQMSRGEAEGRSVFGLARGEWDISALHTLLEERLRKSPSVEGFEVDHAFARLGRRILLLNARRVARQELGELILLAIEDVTERRHAERNVRASEVRYRRLFEAAGDGIVILDPETLRIIDANPVMSDLVGASREELLGRSLGDIGLLGSDETESAIVEKLLADGYLRGEDRTVRTRGGERREVELVGTLYDEGDRRVIQCNLRDLTESKRAELLRESEERLRLANETAGVATFEIDFEKDMLRFSPEAAALLGTAATEPEVAGAGSRFIHPDDQPEWRRRLEALQEPDDGGVMRCVLRTTPRGDDTRWTSLIARAYFRDTADGRKAVRAIGTVQDITDRKLLEDRLAHAQKMEAIGLLASGIAHDFNNLLVGVIGNASLLQEVLPGDNEVQPVLARIVSAGQHATFLTRQLLAYAGKGAVEAEPVDLSQVVRDSVELLRSTIPSKIELKLSLAESLPPVRADHSQIEQVFMNLVLNASEAIGGEAGSITVETGTRELRERMLNPETGVELRAGPYVVLEVRDTGCGMDEQTRRRIFDPFFTTKFVGRGLGLAAVSGIVRGHGGAIEVSSEVGRGSRFTVLLPVTETKSGPTEGKPQPVTDLRGTGTMLLVDDEEVVRNMASAALTRMGYDVLLAANGPEALKCLRESAGFVTLVILDLGMPGMGGAEVLPELREIRPDLKVVISSGYTESEAMRMFQGMRVSGFIQKPYTTTQLAEQVKAAIG